MVVIEVIELVIVVALVVVTLVVEALVVGTLVVVCFSNHSDGDIDSHPDSN